MGSRSPRPWLIAVPTAGLVVLGLAWSGFWFYASSRAEDTMTAWRAREANAGRIYGCDNAQFGGYPFRIEVTCADPSVDDRATALSIRAQHLAAVAQVWDPTLVIGEIESPVTIAPLGGTPTTSINWMLGQASLRGVPGAPERLSIVIERPKLESVPVSGSGPLVEASHAEFHARFAPESTPGHPVVDLAVDFASLRSPALGKLVTTPTDAQVVAVLRGAHDITPKPLGQWLREIQAANGRLDVTTARIQQGDLIINAAGALTLTPNGTLNGNLALTVVNVDKLVPLLGIDRAIAQAVPPNTLALVDRIVPGLGNVLRGNGGNARTASGAADAGGGNGGAGSNGAGSNGGAGGNSGAPNIAVAAAALGGQRTELEGHSALKVTLRLDNGNVFLGPLKVAQVPPLF
jgi:hypothetical protein